MLIVAHESAPHPLRYGRTAAGGQAGVKATIDSMMRENEVISSGSIDRIFRSYFSV